MPVLTAKGRFSIENQTAANAGRSFWEETGSWTGAKGLRSFAGLAQQAGVEHGWESQSVQEQLGPVLFESAMATALALGRLPQSKATPISMATAALATTVRGSTFARTRFLCA